MIIKEIKGCQYKVNIGESEVVETLTEELSNEAVGFVARIEETANDLLELKYSNEEVGKASIMFTLDVLTEMHNMIKSTPMMKRDDILKYFNEMYNKLEGQLNE